MTIVQKKRQEPTGAILWTLPSCFNIHVSSLIKYEYLSLEHVLQSHLTKHVKEEESYNLNHNDFILLVDLNVVGLRVSKVFTKISLSCKITKILNSASGGALLKFFLIMECAASTNKLSNNICFRNASTILRYDLICTIARKSGNILLVYYQICLQYFCKPLHTLRSFS